MDMAPTEHQTKDGVFRLMTEDDASKCRWTVSISGKGLEPTPFVRKPIDHPYDGGLGGPEQYACFKCPRALVRDGLNEITIVLDRGAGATVQYMDLVLP